MAAARGMEIPPADEVPPELEYRLTKRTPSDNSKDKSLQYLTIPIGPRSQSFQSDTSSAPISPIPSSLPLPGPSPPPPSSSPSTNIFRTRAKTLASLTTSSRTNSQADMTPGNFSYLQILLSTDSQSRSTCIKMRQNAPSVFCIIRPT